MRGPGHRRGRCAGSVAGIDAAAFRAQFPVLDRVAYLNAGSTGPVPRAAAEAAAAELERQLAAGRGHDHFERRSELLADLRGRYASVLGAAPDDVAVTTGTSEGLGRVLAGMGLGPGDEVLTSDSEHPGLVGPLLALRSAGVSVRPVPLRDVADAVGPGTSAVACSHVSWLTGEVAPAALADLDVPVILDGAQGAGAIDVDVGALGCAAYAAAGQKWLCGADGTGMLYLAPEFRARLRCVAPAYFSFVDASAGFDAELRADAAAFDTPVLSAEVLAFSLAGARALDGADRQRGPALAARLAERLSAAGRTVLPRADTTLVTWEQPDATATSERLAALGIVVRDLPNVQHVRASVGAWNDEADLDRLLAALSG
jgi:selenocysteine lyase/cysteine desulfurase